MQREEWTRARALFEQALELPETERQRFIETSAEGALRRQLLSMLACAEVDDTFLTPPEPLPAEPALEALGPGDRIGAYELVRLIGAGGMGNVFEALQEQPARRVALKVMRQGLRSRDAVRRFQLEAEALGRLQHPGIATIFEAGVRPAGSAGLELPFFAMEFVPGARDLVGYARAQGLSLRERVVLLCEACSAVHHGHQKGVIHRDLKPGNVLVDAGGRVKVIDYGVARVAEPARGALETRWGTYGTLPYMSPEQLRGDPDGIDVRTDVHALGAVLFELLTGQTPHDVAHRPLAEAVEVLARAPAPPSALVAEVPVELDWVVLKALEPDRERRYGTAAELEQDLRRFLAEQPVQAGPASALYRLRKLYRRHRLALTAAALVLIAILLGLAGTTAGLLRARRAERLASFEKEQAEQEAERAAEMLDFLSDSLAAADPRRAGRELKLTDYLERAAASIDARFAKRPDLRGYLHGVVGRVWSGLGALEEAELHLTQALELVGATPTPDPRMLSRAQSELGVLFTTLGRHAEARTLFEAAEAGLLAAGLGETKDRFRVALNHAWLALEEGQREGVEESLRAAIEGLDRTAGERSEGSIAGRNMLAGLLQGEQRLAEAERIYRELLPAAVEALGPEASETLRIQNNLALTRHALGDRAGAIPELAALLETRRRVLGPQHPEAVMTASNLASLYFLEQRYEEASALYTAALETLSEQLPADHPTVLTLRVNLGSSEVRRGNPSGAEEHLREVYRARQAALGEGHERTLSARFELGSLERVLGRLEPALQLQLEGLALARNLGPTHPLVSQYELELGATCLDLGRLEEARAWITRSLEATSAGATASPELSTARAHELLDELERRAGATAAPGHPASEADR